MKNYSRWALLMIIAVCIALFFVYDIQRFLTLSFIKSQQQSFEDFYAQNPWLTVGLYMLIYILSTALSLPGAVLLTLLGGALFGVLMGTIIVSFASTIGATLAFLTARFLLKNYVENNFNKQLEAINKGIRNEGAFYLFTLRLIPAIPFFVINLVMGLTSMRVLTFFSISQVGMLPGTIVYVNAGTQLSRIESIGGIASPSIILSFVALGLFPILTKKIIYRFTKRNKDMENV